MYVAIHKKVLQYQGAVLTNRRVSVSVLPVPVLARAQAAATTTKVPYVNLYHRPLHFSQCPPTPKRHNVECNVKEKQMEAESDD